MSAYFYMAEVKRDNSSRYMRQARNYLAYIKTRRGPDYEEGHPRLIFDAYNNDVKTEFVLAAVEKQPLTQTSVFFVTLNPNSLHFDCQRLVRFVFSEYRVVRGVELEWFAAIHNHSNHSHAHMIIMPTDARDRSSVVRFLDMHLIRYLANQWLNRHRSGDERSSSRSVS